MWGIFAIRNVRDRARIRNPGERRRIFEEVRQMQGMANVDCVGNHTASDIEYPIPKAVHGYVLMALDASDVSEKGRSGRTFRLHYAIDILKMMSMSYKITGQKVGETLLNYELKKNWLIIADRIYGSLKGIEHCLSQGANFILRLKHNAFKMYRADGTQIDLLTEIADDAAKDIEVHVKLAQTRFVKLRVCVGRIPGEKLAQVERRNKKKAKVDHGFWQCASVAGGQHYDMADR